MLSTSTSLTLWSMILASSAYMEVSNIGASTMCDHTSMLLSMLPPAISSAALYTAVLKDHAVDNIITEVSLLLIRVQIQSGASHTPVELRAVSFSQTSFTSLDTATATSALICM